MFLVTSQLPCPKDKFSGYLQPSISTGSREMSDFMDARKEAERRAREGHTHCRVWALACSVTIETKAVWSESRPVNAPTEQEEM